MTYSVQVNKLDFMTVNPSIINNLFSAAEPLFGRTPDDAELQSFLSALGKWPIPEFGAEDFYLYIPDKAQGYCLFFEDADILKHPAAAGKPPRTPILVGCFFYNEGVDEYHAFAGALPLGITWADTASSLVSKLGPPKNEIKNKKTGLLSSHRWPAGQLLVSAVYRGGGTSIKHIYVGIV
jgi:hypothetical protein